MLEKAFNYITKEYTEMKEWFENPNVTLSDNMKRVSIDRAIARCLGVAMFVQELGVTYEELNPHFEETKLKLMKLLEREE